MGHARKRLHRANGGIDRGIAQVATLTASGVTAPLNHTTGSHSAANVSQNGRTREETHFSPQVINGPMLRYAFPARLARDSIAQPPRTRAPRPAADISLQTPASA